MATNVYGVEINESDDLPASENFQLVLIPPYPPGVTIEDGTNIKFTEPGLWVIQLGFNEIGRNWLTINWQQGALSTTVEPQQITITHMVAGNMKNEYPFSTYFVFDGKTYLFDPTIIDDPPG